MAYTLYDATVVMAKGALTSLDGMLAKAEAHPNAAKICTGRLIDDMKPLPFQVHYATFMAEQLAATLSGREYAEPETYPETYEEMHQRIKQALEALDGTEKDAVNQKGESSTPFVVRTEAIEVPVKAIVGSRDMPNVYFHVVIAYAILRKEGVPLSKRDWSRSFVSGYV